MGYPMPHGVGRGVGRGVVLGDLIPARVDPCFAPDVTRAYFPPHNPLCVTQSCPLHASPRSIPTLYPRHYPLCVPFCTSDSHSLCDPRLFSRYNPSVLTQHCTRKNTSQRYCWVRNKPCHCHDSATHDQRGGLLGDAPNPPE